MTCLFGTQFDSTVEVYSEYHIDNVATGQRIRNWQYEGTVQCKVAPIRMRASVQEYERIGVGVDSQADIVVTTSNKMKLTSRLYNIIGAGGDTLWAENDGSPTVFEIESYRPIVDPFGNVIAFEHPCRRSTDQKVYP